MYVIIDYMDWLYKWNLKRISDIFFWIELKKSLKSKVEFLENVLFVFLLKVWQLVHFFIFKVLFLILTHDWWFFL